MSGLDVQDLLRREGKKRSPRQPGNSDSGRMEAWSQTLEAVIELAERPSPVTAMLSDAVTALQEPSPLLKHLEVLRRLSQEMEAERMLLDEQVGMARVKSSVFLAVGMVLGVLIGMLSIWFWPW